MYNCPASDPLARYSPDDQSKDAVAYMRGFLGFMDPCPVGILHYDMSPTIDSARGNQKMRE
eukprot:9254229-Ditylum_brightwellii.AAC.1